MRSALTAALFVIASAIVAQERVPDRSISVSGNAEIRVVPDKVEIAVGVETTRPEMIKAKAENDAAVARIIAAAKQNGIDPTKIQTNFMEFEPKYADNNPSKPIVGYSVNRSMAIESTELDRFEDLMTAVVAAGANHIHSIRFTTTKLRQHRDEARRMAAKAAQEKAQLLAETLGRKLGPARTISESSDHWSPWRGAMMQNVSQNAMNMAGESSGDSAFAPGRISVSATVSVTFDLQ